MKLAQVLILVLIATFSFQSQSAAQSRFGKVVQAKFGVAGGVNWSGLREVQIGSLTIDYEAQQGWHAGAFVDIGFLFLGVKPGVYYVNAGKLFSKGLLENLPESGLESNPTNFDVTYISVPIDVKIGIPLPIIIPYLFIGPEFKFNTVSDSKGPIASRLESTVAAGNAGIGVAISLGRIQLYPEFRYVFGISDTFTAAKVQIGENEYDLAAHAEDSFVVRLGIGI